MIVCKGICLNEGFNLPVCCVANDLCLWLHGQSVLSSIFLHKVTTCPGFMKCVLASLEFTNNVNMSWTLRLNILLVSAIICSSQLNNSAGKESKWILPKHSFQNIFQQIRLRSGCYNNNFMCLALLHLCAVRFSGCWSNEQNVKRFHG